MMNPCSNDQMKQDSLKPENDAEIDQMAKTIALENKIKMTLLKKTAVVPDNQAPLTQIPATEPLSAESTSEHGQFGWAEIANSYYPYIMRSGEKYVAVRMLQFKKITKPSKEIANCADFERFTPSKVEAELLNEINIQHCDNCYGQSSFTDQDKLLHIEDAIELYKFFEFCNSKLRQQSTVGDKRCGFIRVAPETFLPFVWSDSKQYVPLFYLGGEVEYLVERSVELKGWALTYLKFLCKVHSTFKSIPDQKSVSVVDLEFVKECYLPGTTFEEMWPTNNKIEALLKESISDKGNADWESILQGEITRNKIPDATGQLGSTLERPNMNLNTAPTSGNSDSNARPGPGNVESTNLGQSTQNGDRSYNEVVVSQPNQFRTLPQIVLANQNPAPTSGNSDPNRPGHVVSTNLCQSTQNGGRSYNVVIVSQPNQSLTVPHTVFTNSNLNTAPTSRNYNSVNPHTTSKRVQQRHTARRGPYNNVKSNLCRSIQNGSRTYNEVVVNETNQGLIVSQAVLNTAPTSENSAWINPQPKLGSYNVGTINLGRSTQNGGKAYNQVVTSLEGQTLTVPQGVFTNLSNCCKQVNSKAQLSNPQPHINGTQSVPCANKKRGCQLCQIPDFPNTDHETHYHLDRYQIGNVTFEHSINIAPNDNFTLVTLSEVSCVFLKVPYAVLRKVLDYLNFVVYMPNQAQKTLLTSVGLIPGMGLVSVLDVKKYEARLRRLCTVNWA